MAFEANQRRSVNFAPSTGCSLNTAGESMPAKSWEIAAGYHQRTKHHFDRYAQSLGYLDWATQPDPFRRYEGCPLVKLPIPRVDRGIPFENVYALAAVPRPMNMESLSELFFFSLALSAWKEHGSSRWALRVNPSSGNLHPTEAYLVAPPIEGLNDVPSLFHYAPKEHGLEIRARLDSSEWSRMTASSIAGAVFIGLSSVAWRESWKYGERAYRYCQHDVGHALASIRLSAALLGWRVTLLATVSDATVGRLLGLDRKSEFASDEPESPDLLLFIHSTELDDPPIHDDSINTLTKTEWFGRANRLSVRHHPWDVIELVDEACRLSVDAKCAPHGPDKPAREVDSPDSMLESFPPCGKSADQVIRTRRSAQSLDGQTGIQAVRLYAMLERLLPHAASVPWDMVPWRPLVHLGIFLHRVEGLSPGLYVFVRDKGKEAALSASMRSSFLWSKPAGCPDDLPLYLLVEGDSRRAAKHVSCHQDIASDGAFSLGMIAEFEPILRDHGAYWYRRLFWETGIIGQVLYLEAEAAGIRATGIGCFFDDPVHEIFGIKDMRFQSLYHFTMGGPIEDQRLTTIAPYG